MDKHLKFPYANTKIKILNPFDEMGVGCSLFLKQFRPVLILDCSPTWAFKFKVKMFVCVHPCSETERIYTFGSFISPDN